MFQRLTHRTAFVCHGRVLLCPLNKKAAVRPSWADASDAHPLSGGPQRLRKDLRGGRNALHAVDGRKCDERQNELK